MIRGWVVIGCWRDRGEFGGVGLGFSEGVVVKIKCDTYMSPDLRRGRMGRWGWMGGDCGEGVIIGDVVCTRVLGR